MSEFHTLPLCRPHVSGLTCVHVPLGLCPACSEEYDEDPCGFYHYGSHPEGIANSKRLDEEIRLIVEEEAKLRSREVIELNDGLCPHGRLDDCEACSAELATGRHQYDCQCPRCCGCDGWAEPL